MPSVIWKLVIATALWVVVSVSLYFAHVWVRYETRGPFFIASYLSVQYLRTHWIGGQIEGVTEPLGGGGAGDLSLDHAYTFYRHRFPESFEGAADPLSASINEDMTEASPGFIASRPSYPSLDEAAMGSFAPLRKASGIDVVHWYSRDRVVYSMGFPFQSFRTTFPTVSLNSRGPLPGAVRLRYIPAIGAIPIVPRPLWCIANALFWFFTVELAAMGWHIRRRRVRDKRGLCVACGYPLVGLDRGAACPECGVARKA